VIWDKLPNDLGADLSAAQQAEFDRCGAEYKIDPTAALTEYEFNERMRIAHGK
jgi:putative addiction module component (TIGR02574 family)